MINHRQLGSFRKLFKIYEGSLRKSKPRILTLLLSSITPKKHLKVLQVDYFLQTLYLILPFYFFISCLYSTIFCFSFLGGNMTKNSYHWKTFKGLMVTYYYKNFLKYINISIEFEWSQIIIREGISQLDILCFREKHTVTGMDYILLSHWPKRSHGHSQTK